MLTNIVNGIMLSIHIYKMNRYDRSSIEMSVQLPNN